MWNNRNIQWEKIQDEEIQNGGEFKNLKRRDGKWRNSKIEKLKIKNEKIERMNMKKIYKSNSTWKSSIQ